MADSPPGGGAVAALVIGVPVAVGIAGYFVGGPQHRALGVLGGLAAGFVGMIALSKIQTAQAQAQLRAETPPSPTPNPSST
jgi:purine-cytosine permease-like protein